MTFYELREVKEPRFTGEYNARHRWGLPGIHCPVCDATWSDGSEAYPCVDLSSLAERQKLETARLEEDYAEFERLCELVKPFMPAGVRPWPGTKFGPLMGTARGSFGQLVLQYEWTLLIRREALEQLQADGVRGLKGCRTELRFRQKNAPELLELEIEPAGLLHADCLPANRAPPCVKCGRDGFSLPEHRFLDRASMPEDRDLFRLANFQTVLVATERFVEAVRRRGFEEIAFWELPAR